MHSFDPIGFIETWRGRFHVGKVAPGGSRRSRKDKLGGEEEVLPLGKGEA